MYAYVCVPAVSGTAPHPASVGLTGISPESLYVAVFLGSVHFLSGISSSDY